MKASREDKALAREVLGRRAAAQGMRIEIAYHSRRRAAVAVRREAFRDLALLGWNPTRIGRALGIERNAVADGLAIIGGKTVEQASRAEQLRRTAADLRTRADALEQYAAQLDPPQEASP